ncbi:thioesterase family protein [Gordonia sp. VNK21]|uniref:thioesterase family protein n=1 Tax=Gordonia sp. VNK21 TaxID=3382483 RepID=UPI0038D450D8
MDDGVGISGATAPQACYVLERRTTDDWGETEEWFYATELTHSPWGLNVQHGGPVAGLLCRTLERCGLIPGTRLARLTVDLLGPVPATTVKVRSWVERPGTKVALLIAEMWAPAPGGGPWRPVARAQAWRLATGDSTEVAAAADPSRGFPGGRPLPLPDAWTVGFINAVNWHVATPIGNPGGPTLAWLSLKVPLVAGEAPSPLTALMSVSDIANGLGARVDPFEWTFLNTELTVHLFGPPAQGWVGLECETSMGDDGIAMTAGVIHSPGRPLGRIAQCVLLERRPVRAG